MRGKTTEKQISDPHELNRFLATPWIEVVKLLFSSDADVWTLWNYAAKDSVPSLRHTNEVVFT